jgi:[ribosomal protein S18]-alanine N-acetyltransferase
MNVVINKLAYSDIQALTELELTSHSNGWSKANIQSALHSAHQHCYGGWQDKKLVGYVVVTQLLPDWELLNIVVAKSKQHMGLGRTLLEFVIEQARAENAQKILLELRQSNQAALKLYERFGFQVTAIRKNYYTRNETKENAILMQLVLN